MKTDIEPVNHSSWPGDDSHYEWIVTDGRHSYRCTSEEDARYLAEVLREREARLGAR